MVDYNCDSRSVVSTSWLAMGGRVAGDSFLAPRRTGISVRMGVEGRVASDPGPLAVQRRDIAAMPSRFTVRRARSSVRVWKALRIESGSGCCW